MPAMTATRPEPSAPIQGSDEAAFAALFERHRRELHVHCYRMLASFDEAEDAVQETFLRAWRAREAFEGASLFRAWLYRIATNVCLDALRRRGRAGSSVETSRDVPWLQPYPDSLLDEVPAADEPPESVAVERETISLVFLVALQVLPPRQRAALIARDVLGWPANETASMLETSVPAANSALQRARSTMQAHLPPRRSDWAAPPPTERERAHLSQFIEAPERGDPARAASLSAQDLRITMPPLPFLYEGLDSIRPLLGEANRMGEWRLVATSANRMPTAASYLRRPGDTLFRAFKFDVIRVRDGAIAEITTFGPELFARFGLPETRSPDDWG